MSCNYIMIIIIIIIIDNNIIDCNFIVLKGLVHENA